ncbi:hypothetical protein T05_6657 [Trichinella murrelli]|uniref:Uncharacterized protein n=1 Tax=Trichinella murrelli TaxID=144512 RepID=A0A0V0TKA3_9BILA|nr:hypothetical protein T05_6657 [Trichinella murrelli]
MTISTSMDNDMCMKHYDEHYDDLEPIPFLFGDSETLRKAADYLAIKYLHETARIYLFSPDQTTEKNSIVHVVMFKDCGNDEKNRELDIENYSPSEWLFFLIDKISISGQDSHHSPGGYHLFDKPYYNILVAFS